ncbi:fatty acid desaturase [Haliangium sp.]|uniref:fatty acid desaturase n=1 Tax=Haliangium sp. TaxID=2663208 RepID=UPI003D1198E3
MVHVLAGVFVLTAFVLTAWTLSALPFGPAWLLACAGQGALIQLAGYLNHEMVVHLNVGGPRWRRVLGTLFLTPTLLMQFTPYHILHIAHHKDVGSVDDEGYKDDLDTRWKRLLFATFPGLILASVRMFEPRARKRHRHALGPTSVASTIAAYAARTRGERVAVLAVLGLGLLLCPNVVLYGWLVPLVVAFPVWNAVRVVLEHSEVNPDHPLHCATFYCTGPLTRLMFGWDAGDCHLIHHIYPGIPWYHMGRAVKLSRPFLRQHGVVERRTLSWLLWQYFARNRRHGALWPIRSESSS